MFLFYNVLGYMQLDVCTYSHVKKVGYSHAISPLVVTCEKVGYNSAISPLVVTSSEKSLIQQCNFTSSGYMR